MIQAFVGLVGGGKSFCSVRRMMSYMALGGRCAANIRLCGWDDKLGDLSPDSPVLPYLRSLGWQYQPHQYLYIPFEDMTSDPSWYKRVPAGQSRDLRTLLVVDEATDLFDTLDGGKLRSDSGYRELFHFLRLSRHAHIDVLFVCQDINSINSRLRSLVANVWRSTDMRHFRVGIFKMGFPADVFLLQLYDRTGKYQISREFVRKDQRIFTLYESETFGGSLGVKWDGVSVDQSKGKIQKKGKPKMTLPWKIAFVLLLVSVVWLAWRDFSRPVSSPSVPDDVVSNAVHRALANIRGDGGNYSPHYYPSTNRTSVVRDKASASSRASDAPARRVVPVAPNRKIDPGSAPQNLRKEDFLRGDYQFGQAQNRKWCIFDGSRFEVGLPSEFGRCILVDRYFAMFVADDGHVTYLLPFDDKAFAAATGAPSPRFTSSGDGAAARRGPWYYAHTGTSDRKGAGYEDN